MIEIFDLSILKRKNYRRSNERSKLVIKNYESNKKNNIQINIKIIINL